MAAMEKAPGLKSSKRDSNLILPLGNCWPVRNGTYYHIATLGPGPRVTGSVIVRPTRTDLALCTEGFT